MYEGSEGGVRSSAECGVAGELEEKMEKVVLSGQEMEQHFSGAPQVSTQFS